MLSMRELWRFSIGAVERIRFEIFSTLLKTYLSSVVTSDIDMENLLSCTVHDEMKGPKKSWLQPSLDIGETGTISSLNIAFQHLPDELNLVEAIDIIKNYRGFVIMPMSFKDAIHKCNNLVAGEADLQIQLASYLFPSMFKPNDVHTESSEIYLQKSTLSDYEYLTISWKMVIGPRNIGKTTRLLGACSRFIDPPNKSFYGNMVWFDVRGVRCHYSMVDILCSQIGFEANSFLSLEVKLENFFVTLKSKGSIIVFDHVETDSCATALYVYFKAIQYSINIEPEKNEVVSEIDRKVNEQLHNSDKIPFLFEIVVVGHDNEMLSNVFKQIFPNRALDKFDPLGNKEKH